MIPIVKELVLLGGGHSHAIFINMFAMNPIEGLSVTLISDVTHTPYSGMLPGLVVGSYSYDEVHIDLRKICSFANIRFIRAKVTDLDLDSKKVILEGRLPISYDFLSINIGSRPNKSTIEGAEEFLVPAKPIPNFLDGWKRTIDSIESGRANKISIIGAGAGGVELALNMKKKFGEKCHVTLLDEESEILRTHNKKVRLLLKKVLEKNKIEVVLNFKVKKISKLEIESTDSQKIATDFGYLITHASPAKWLKKSGLSCDEKGFVLVEDTLQSCSHKSVFAVGDTATMKNHHRPKSGVFAVRQGPPLFKNIGNLLKEIGLVPYKPQEKFLGLIGTGGDTAVASYGDSFAMQSAALWRIKDWIDRKFMARFINLEPMEMVEAELATRNDKLTPDLRELTQKSMMRCTGCAGKIGSDILHRSLNRVKAEGGNDPKLKAVLSGMDSPDDGAILTVSSGMSLVQSIDYFSALVTDPFLFGQIALNHSFSDVYAMGAKPHSAQILALVPYASRHIMTENIYQMVSGVVSRLKDIDAPLTGGHTAENQNLAIGIVANGEINPDKILRKSNLKIGDFLIMTKGLGVGTLFAAEMRLKAKGRWIDDAIDSMLNSNYLASQILLKHSVKACTDVTGFGLIGHLLEMLEASDVAAKIELDNILVLKGAIETSKAGFLSSIHSSNQQGESYISNLERGKSHDKFPLLFDPQTSGGLLASVCEADLEACLAELRNSGYETSMIGKVVESDQSENRVEFS